MSVKSSLLVTLTLSSFLMGCAATSGPPKTGMRYLEPYPTSGVHGGLDLDVPYGSPVRAIADGEVVVVSADPKEIYLTISHGNGYTSYYYHLGNVVVKERAAVKRGEVIAVTGRTGYASPARTQMITYPHLHLEIYKDGNRINPEMLDMKCPSPASQWWWPVGCEDSYKK